LNYLRDSLVGHRILTLKEVKDVLKAQLEGLKKEGDKVSELSQFVVNMEKINEIIEKHTRNIFYCTKPSS
jgi:hypothetical protein